MPLTDAQRERLPKAVQRELSRLKADNEYYKQMVEAGPEDSDTFATGTDDADRPLGRGTRIYFRDKGSTDNSRRVPYIEAYLVDGGVIVRSSDSLTVSPMASNTIKVRAVPFGGS